MFWVCWSDGIPVTKWWKQNNKLQWTIKYKMVTFYWQVWKLQTLHYWVCQSWTFKLVKIWKMHDKNSGGLLSRPPGILYLHVDIISNVFIKLHEAVDRSTGGKKRLVRRRGRTGRCQFTVHSPDSTTHSTVTSWRQTWTARQLTQIHMCNFCMQKSHSILDTAVLCHSTCWLIQSKLMSNVIFKH